MKLTKSKLKQIIKEELKSLADPPRPEIPRTAAETFVDQFLGVAGMVEEGEVGPDELVNIIANLAIVAKRAQAPAVTGAPYYVTGEDL